jgi:hypothetical protein
LIICFTEQQWLSAVNGWAQQHRTEGWEDETEACTGIFMCSNPMFTDKEDRVIGAIVLLATPLTHGVIAHEVWHAVVFHEFGMLGYRGHYEDALENYSPEERAANFVESITSEIYGAIKEWRLEVENEDKIF